MSDDLLAELNLPSARGARRVAAPVAVSIVRELTEADLPALQAPGPVDALPSRIARVSYSHHQLARLLARGEDHTTASLITGYSMSWISALMGDPAFTELLATYSAERQQVFVDALERMRTLGISAVEELQARLEEEPEGWSRREMMELAELMLIKSGATGAKTGLGAGAPSVTINVSPRFVQATQTQPPADTDAAVDLAWTDPADG